MEYYSVGVSVAREMNNARLMFQENLLEIVRPHGPVCIYRNKLSMYRITYFLLNVSCLLVKRQWCCAPRIRRQERQYDRSPRARA